MEHIIQQLALDLGKNILDKALNVENSELDLLCKDILEDCKSTARQMLSAIIEHWNEEIRKDKAGRKETGLVIQQRNRKRSQVTSLGVLGWTRDYYYDKKNDSYVYPLDELLDVTKYDRIAKNISADLINQAAYVSYARSAATAADGLVSKQSVRNQILKLMVPEAEAADEKRTVRELHIYADEDHAHLQKEHKEKGKQGQFIPLVTVTEGTKEAGTNRNATIKPVRFVDETFKPKQLWKTVEGYIDSAYDIDSIERIWIHGDGGAWIRNGLEGFSQTLYVMDGYHFFKAVKRLSRQFPERNVRILIEHSLKEDDRAKADHFLQELMDTARNKEDRQIAKDFGTYLFGHWDEIRRRITEAIPGSCTEGQVSHVLSERFSRDPIGWSKKALGKLAGARVSNINGRPITGEDIRPAKDRSTYAEYADRYIRERCQGAVDWSIFDGEPNVYDAKSGTQFLIRSYGEIRSLLN